MKVFRIVPRQEMHNSAQAIPAPRARSPELLEINKITQHYLNCNTWFKVAFFFFFKYLLQYRIFKEKKKALNLYFLDKTSHFGAHLLAVPLFGRIGEPTHCNVNPKPAEG